MRFGCHYIRHQRLAHTHPSQPRSQRSFPFSTKFAYCMRRLNAAETWQRGYESVSFVARYSFLHCTCRAGLDEARSDDSIHPGSLYFASEVGPCTGIVTVEPFKHLLPVTSHPQFLALEPRAFMGARSGQYGIKATLLFNSLKRNDSLELHTVH